MGGETRNTPQTAAAIAAGALPENEVKERIAILKRFRELLIEQRERFRNYLTVLDKQKKIIADGSADDLTAHIEMEEKIIADIFTVQKSIEPMSVMFENSWKGQSAPDIQELKTNLLELKTEATRRVGENKKLLQDRLTVLRTEIKTLRANPFVSKRRSVYGGGNTASLLDIKG